MALQPKTKKTLLDSITLNARALQSTRIVLDGLIRRAVRSGIPQTTVAKAAGVSQAHVSRVAAAGGKTSKARKPARRPKASREGGTV